MLQKVVSAKLPRKFAFARSTLALLPDRLSVDARSRSRRMSSQKAQEGLDWAEYHTKWESMWSAGLEPGQQFDKERAAIPLVKLLKSGQLDLAGKSALVPGCGRGYDVVEFAMAGAARSVGLEIAPTAITAAQAHWDAAGLPEDVKSRMHFVQGDFFLYEDEAGKFDVGYDYTFLCALHPEMRTSWAEAWIKHIKPGGELITTMFPVDPSMEFVGPPWPLTTELYSELLGGSFTRISLEPVPPEDCHPGRAGRTHFARWKRND